MPVITALWEARGVDHLRSGAQDHSGRYAEIPSLLKIQKLAGCGGIHLQSQLLRKLRNENCLNPVGRGWSELRLHHCSPVWMTRAKLHLKKKSPTKKWRIEKKLWMLILITYFIFSNPKYQLLFINNETITLSTCNWYNLHSFFY